MEGKEVNQVKSFKYIGVLLDECLSFNDHINYVRSKVASRLGLLSLLRGCLSTEAANKIYLSTVLPILSYCDTCFYPLGSTSRKCLDRLQRRAARIVDGFKPDITTESILENQGGKRPGGETGSPLLVQGVMRRRTGTSAPSALPVQLMAAKNLLSTNQK